MDGSVDQKEPGKPVGSLILSILGLILWILPILGLPVTIVGFVFGFKAIKRKNNALAIVGVVLCSLGILASAGNMIWGAYLGVTGQHPIANKLLGK